ncbi:MAG: aminotransferase class IV [Tissierellales bacterium]|nr:aminotransferase class IV [Tissierellales bacterium]MBN2826740.1 aminotransferase class IV [Tissierellales bacterium]
MIRDNILASGVMNDLFVSIEEIFETIEKSGKTVYEVIRLIDGKPLFLEDHITRFNNSINLIGEADSYTREEIIDLINTLIFHQNQKNNNIKITYSKIEDKIFLLGYYTKSQYPDRNKIIAGYKAVLLYEERENPNAKVLNNDLKEIISNILEEEKADECIYVSEYGEVLEGSRTNIFFIKGNSVVTAPDQEVLLGTTRKKIEEICHQKRIAIHKKTIRVEDLPIFDAVFATGTSIDVMPINLIGSIVYHSSVNRIVESLMREYEKEKKSYINQFKK